MPFHLGLKQALCQPAAGWQVEADQGLARKPGWVSGVVDALFGHRPLTPGTGPWIQSID
jgi:hypothetical protein